MLQDIAKTALIRAEESLVVGGVEAELVMMIHDEMVWQVGEGKVDTAASIVRECLQTCARSQHPRGSGGVST